LEEFNELVSIFQVPSKTLWAGAVEGTNVAARTATNTSLRIEPSDDEFSRGISRGRRSGFFKAQLK
jgi:hypothetical protein